MSALYLGDMHWVSLKQQFGERCADFLLALHSRSGPRTSTSVSFAKRLVRPSN